ERARLGHGLVRRFLDGQDGLEFFLFLRVQLGQRVIANLLDIRLKPLAALVIRRLLEPGEVCVALGHGPTCLQVSQALDVLHLLFLRGRRGDELEGLARHGWSFEIDQELAQVRVDLIVLAWKTWLERGEKAGSTGVIWPAQSAKGDRVDSQ